jgi:hypothetical protein
MGIASRVAVDRHEHRILAAPDTTAANGEYDAALANLLAHAVKRPGGLHRLRRTSWAGLRSLLCRWRDEINRYPPEYWFM